MLLTSHKLLQRHSFPSFSAEQREEKMSPSHYTQKPHVVCIPFPAQGHINPIMQFAKILHKKGFYITFVNSEYNHKRYLRSLGPEFINGKPDFRFEAIPDGLPPPPEGFDATQNVPILCHSTRKTCYGPFKELVSKLQSSPDVPPITLILADGNIGFAVKVARDLGIPDAQFWTASACGFQAYAQYEELIQTGIVPFKDENFLLDGTLDTPIDWIPGMPNMRLKDIPSFIRVTDKDDLMLNFMTNETKECLEASSILINTFYDLESAAIDALKAKNPNIYNVGPLHLLGRHFISEETRLSGSSLWKTDPECIQWLNKWGPNSVIYVSYGCSTIMTDEHLREFAWGLADSKVPFLWVVRPDVTRTGEQYGDAHGNLPQPFLDEIKDRGYITSWSPQNQVLAHPAVGVFLSHCGWNSTIESVSEGKPMICWPFFAEQQTNCRYANTTWGIGLEVNPDVKREEVAALVREAILGEKGKQMRQNGLQWKEKAIKATEAGGASYNDFNRFLKEALHFDA